MSASQRIAVVCPECNMSQDVECWHSLNVTLDERLRTKLFDGQINTVTCPTCGYLGSLPVPLLYHDVQLQLAIQYLPSEALSDARQLQRFTSDGRLDLRGLAFASSPSLAYLFEPHVVFSLQEMRRYVEFREALAAFDDAS
jgi:hypothetical protein